MFVRPFQLSVGILLMVLWSMPESFAVTRYHSGSLGFVTDIAQLHPSLQLPIGQRVEMVRAPEAVLRNRASASQDDERIEPLMLAIPEIQEQRENLALDLARPGQSRRLLNYLERKRTNASEQTDSDENHAGRLRVSLDKQSLRLLDLAKVAEMLEQPHFALTIDGARLQQSAATRRELYSQVRPFIAQEDANRLKRLLRQGEEIDVEKHLLPEFAKQMIRRYTQYRGPNCFHAALAFHSVDMTTSPYINFKEEPGYHRAMINYDELWRAVNKNFYEIDPSKSPLKYGDMILFFDIPDANSEVQFRWIRHAATYLFGPYTFSKGSKSPNTPYTIKTVQQEWQTWQRMSKNLGVKVFRRSPKNVTNRPPVDRIDWIY